MQKCLLRQESDPGGPCAGSTTDGADHDGGAGTEPGAAGDAVGVAAEATVPSQPPTFTARAAATPAAATRPRDLDRTVRRLVGAPNELRRRNGKAHFMTV
jgi:hypothetical protein